MKYGKPARFWAALLWSLSLLSSPAIALEADPIAVLSKFLKPIIDFISRVDISQLGTDPFSTNFVSISLGIAAGVLIFHQINSAQRTSTMSRGGKLTLATLGGVFIAAMPKVIVALFGKLAVATVSIFLLIITIMVVAFGARWIWNIFHDHPAMQRIFTGLALVAFGSVLGELFGTYSPLSLYGDDNGFIGLILALLWIIGIPLVILGLIGLISSGVRGGGGGVWRSLTGGGGGGRGGGGGAGGAPPIEPFPTLHPLEDLERETAGDLAHEEQELALQERLAAQQQVLAQREARIAELERQLEERGTTFDAEKAGLIDELQRTKDESAKAEQETAEIRTQLLKMLQDYRGRAQRDIEAARRVNVTEAERLLQEAREGYTRMRDDYTRQLQQLITQNDALRNRMRELTNEILDLALQQKKAHQDSMQLATASMQDNARLAQVIEQSDMVAKDMEKTAKKLRKRGLPGSKEMEGLEEAERSVTHGERRQVKRKIRVTHKMLDKFQKMIKDEDEEIALTRELIECLNPQNLYHDDPKIRKKVQDIVKKLVGEQKKAIKYHHLMDNLYKKSVKSIERERQTGYTLQKLQGAARRSYQQQATAIKRT